MEDSGFRAHNMRMVSGPVALERTSMCVHPVSGDGPKTVAATMAAVFSIHRQQRLQAEAARGEAHTSAAQLMFVPKTTDGCKLQQKAKEASCRLQQAGLCGWTPHGAFAYNNHDARGAGLCGKGRPGDDHHQGNWTSRSRLKPSLLGSTSPT